MLRYLCANALRIRSSGLNYLTSLSSRNGSVSMTPFLDKYLMGNTFQKSFYSLLQVQKPSVTHYQIPLTIIPGSLNAVAASKQLQICRSVTKFSLTKGKRKSVKAVLKRFKRLDWGGWIRTRTGRHKKMFRKSNALKRRLRQHVFVNATQAHLLDKMVTSFWRRPKYWIDDPYAPYHRRDEYFATKRKEFKV
ncbi:mitochondrial ribosomal protein L35 [Glossina fuscipes fuscipes]